MKRKALFIGGTGTISTAITRLVASRDDWQLTLLNRGNRIEAVPEGVEVLQGDIRSDAVADVLGDHDWDVVADFIVFTPEQLAKDIRLFSGHTRQYFFISSASAYKKPVTNYIINESTPLSNPYWQYSRDKAACEDLLHEAQREKGFPYTIIRPSHTYDERNIPVAVHGDQGSWQVCKRMLEGKPVIIPGDGSSLWTVTFNTDFAKGFVGLMGNQHAIGETYQIMSDESLTWNQIYTTVAEALGVELKPCYVPSKILADSGRYDLEGNLLGDKSATVVFDTGKLKRAVPDFKCTVRFDQGVRIAVDNILKHKDLQREDAAFDEWSDKIVEIMSKADRDIKALSL